MPQACRRFTGLLLLAGLLLSMAEAVCAQSGPRRVASLNLCTDQLLLALADRSQIASLSRLARDPSMSFMAEEAVGFRLNDGGVEPLLFDRPDLVLAGTYGQQEQAALLKRQGFEVLSLGSWSSLEDGREQIRSLARRLGHPERGKELIARIDGALERARGIVPGKRSILVYERGGWVAGARSPLGEILAHMGFSLHQEALGLSAGGAARLETIVVTPPRFPARRCRFREGARQWDGFVRSSGTGRRGATGAPLGGPWPAYDLRWPGDAGGHRCCESRGSGQSTVRGLDHSSRSCRAGAGLRRIGQPAATKTTASQASATR